MPQASPEPERLIRRQLARGKERRTGRQLEGVVVPVEHSGRALEVAEHRVARRCRGRDDVEPACFVHGRRAHLRAERPREHLRSEADAEHGEALSHGVGQQSTLDAEKRVLVLLPRVRVATERDDPAPVGSPQTVEVLLPDANSTRRQAGCLETTLEHAETRQAGVLLDREQRLHVRKG